MCFSVGHLGGSSNLEGIKTEWNTCDPVMFLLTYLLTPYSRVLLEKLTGSAASQEVPRILEPEGSSPYSQVPATCPYPVPTPSSPHNHLQLLKIHLNITLPSTSGSSQFSFSLRFPHQNPVHPCPLLILLDFTTRTIFDKE